MEKRILLLTALAFFAPAAVADEVEAGVEATPWTYSGAAGPANWGQIGYPLCNGVKQSPINIEPKAAVFSQFLSKQPLQFLGYDEKFTDIKVHLKNNGHSAVVRIGDALKHPFQVGMSVGGLPGEYILSQFHFHWGKTNDQGSEHTYDGKSYPMELHLVHLNRRYLHSAALIEGNKDGIAVLGILIEVGAYNPAFESIVSALKSTSEPDATEVLIDLPAMRDFLPAELSKYYRYEGSLTTPPCFEAVIWTVLRTPIQISQQQLDEFRMMKIDRSPNKTPSDSNIIWNNYREPMPIGDRVVFVSYSDETAGVLESDTLHMKNWGYTSGHGLAPHEWDKKFEQCGGSQQSPVHIEHSKTIPSTELSNSPWNLKNYDSLPVNVDMLLENNGHTVVVGLGDGVGVSGGGLPGDYRLLQFHIHWGRHNGNGSEHLLDGRQYPAEIHLVHTNKYYGEGKNLDQIQANHDGLAVLGVFIEVGEHNPVFDPLINQLNKVKYQSGQRVRLGFQSLREFLPTDMSEFYRYAGSLTTPPCYEIVVWTVFRNTIKISQEQLNMLRTQVFDSPSPNNTYAQYANDQGQTAPAASSTPAPSGTTTTPKPYAPPAYILDNFRPVQDIGLRVVKYAKILPDMTVGDGGSSTLSLSAYCLLLCAALLMKNLA